MTTSSLFMVLIGALIFANFVNATGMPQALMRYVTAAGLAPMTVLLLIVLVYLVLGCVLESMSMLLLTIPVFSALVSSLDFGLGPAETMIWFGIVVVVVTEISLITPPIGMNVFTLSAMLPDVSTGTIFRGGDAVLVRRRDPAGPADRRTGRLVADALAALMAVRNGRPIALWQFVRSCGD